MEKIYFILFSSLHTTMEPIKSCKDKINLALVHASQDQCLQIKLKIVQLQKQLIAEEEKQKTLIKTLKKFLKDNSKEDTDKEGESDWF